MTMRSTLLALSLSTPTAALAATTSAPTGDNVVVLSVRDVTVAATLPGQCVAKGVVTEVVAGGQFHSGQSIAIKVACSHRTPILDGRPAAPGGATQGGIDATVLSHAKRAVVRLDDTGDVIWQAPSAFPEPRFAQYGRVAGYVVLDGVKLPLSRRVS